MPVTVAPPIRARFPVPDVLQRGAANTLRCPISESGVAVAPTSGTITITDGAGTVQVSAATATISSSVATYSYTPAATLQLGERWVVEWSLVTSTYGTLTFRNDAMLVRNLIYCPISVDDLWPLEPALQPSGSDAQTAMTVADFDAKLEEAWITVQNRLIQMGKRPYLVIGANALREVVQHQTLVLVFRGLETRLPNAYAEKANRYHALLEEAWTRARLTYDEADDGKPDEGRRAARPSALWIGR